MIVVKKLVKIAVRVGSHIFFGSNIFHPNTELALWSWHTKTVAIPEFFILGERNSTMISDSNQETEGGPMRSSTSVATECNGSTLNCGDRPDDVVCSLLNAISLITRLSQLSSKAYKESLDGSELESTSVPLLQSQIDSTLKDLGPQVHESDLSKLVQSIHGWQSLAVESATESEKHLIETASLREELAEARDRIDTLEGAIHKLHQKNNTLREKLRTKKSEKVSILNDVKDYLRERRKTGEAMEQRVIHQLHSHERIMRLEASLRREEWNRSRTSSCESALSDLDPALDPLTDGGGLLDDSRSVLSSSASSLSTTITDEGVATVVIAPNETNKDSKHENSTHVTVISELDMGVQLVRVQLEGPPKGVLDAMLKEKDGAKKEQPTKPTFPVNFHLPRRKEKEEEAFLLCGHYGLDTTRGDLPTLGARLVAINDKKRFDETDIAKLKDANPSKPTILTFWRHGMSIKQSAIVSKAAGIVHADADSGERDLCGVRVIELQRETPLPSLSSFNLFALESPTTAATTTTTRSTSTTLNRNGESTDVGSELEMPSNATSDETPQSPSGTLGSQTTVKLGNAMKNSMKAMGRPFKSLF